MLDGDQSHARARRRRREHEPRAARPRPVALGLAAPLPAGALARREGLARHAISSSATSACTSRRQPTARPARAWASTPRSPRRNGHRPRRSRTRSRSQSHQRAVAALGQRLLRRSRDPGRRRRTRHASRARDTSLGEAREAAAGVRPHQRPGHAHRRQLLAAHRRRGGDLGRDDERAFASCPPSTPRVRLVDWEIAAVDLRNEGLLMAPAYGIPRLLARNGLTYGDIDLWEIHEAFAAQVLVHIEGAREPRVPARQGRRRRATSARSRAIA